MVFSEIDIELTDVVFNRIGKQLMLITAGNKESFNTMTASWGSMGVLWFKPVVTIFIRPVRHTFDFANSNDFFTLCFFDEEHRNMLNYCGKNSGKEKDKIKETGLIPIETERGNIYYEQASLIIECKKLYSDDIKSLNFMDSDIPNKIYPTKDFHRFYIGEVISCLTKK